MATALLEKQKVEKLKAEMRQSAYSGVVDIDTGPVPYYWTVASYYRAYNAGVFEDPKRLELVHGKIIRKMPQNAPHASLRHRLSNQLRGSIGQSFVVMEESPLRLANDGEPVPDIFLVTGEEADYQKEHPTQAVTVLVVEVSNTTVAYDLGEKALLYGQAGIQDYWVVLVNDNAVVVHRESAPDGYLSVERLIGADTLSPLAAPETIWTVDALLGRTEAPEDN